MAKTAKLKYLAPNPDPVEDHPEVVHVAVANVKSDHVRIDVVYDLDTVSYDVGEVDGDVDFKFPILDGGGEFFVRVVDVAFDEKKNAETKKLIARGDELVGDHSEAG
jgi:hypothetical protein